MTRVFLLPAYFAVCDTTCDATRDQVCCSVLQCAAVYLQYNSHCLCTLTSAFALLSYIYRHRHMHMHTHKLIQKIYRHKHKLTQTVFPLIVYVVMCDAFMVQGGQNLLLQRGHERPRPPLSSCNSVLRCVVVCCSVLLWVSVCCCVARCVAVCAHTRTRTRTHTCRNCTHVNAQTLTMCVCAGVCVCLHV